jgi:hypothetical protein
MSISAAYCFDLLGAGWHGGGMNGGHAPPNANQGEQESGAENGDQRNPSRTHKMKRTEHNDLTPILDTATNN